VNLDGTRSTSFPKGPALLMNFLGKLLGKLRPQTQEVQLQRMCPFCGLITPRAKSTCLECGRQLRPVQAERETVHQK
jgi:hypothetical protein